jgi:predicted nucleic acid-binding protein
MANQGPDEAAPRRNVLIVDTNVLVDVLEDDPDWAEWSIGQLRAQAQVHELAINSIIYSELSLTFATVEALDAVVDQMQLTMADIPRAALFLAGRAFLRYRRSGGGKSNVLSDFFIGAHAAVERCPLLTRDARRYRAYFPTVELIAP